MDRYTLYGDRGSGSHPVEMVLAEIGAPVELVEVPLEGDHQLSEDHRRRNPMGRVPVLLLPDGTVVTESLAILLTLAARHPEARLLPPPDDPGHATVLRWMALLAGEFYPHVTRADYPERFSADPAHAPAIRARAMEMGREVWSVLEANAPFGPDGQGPYLLGDRFTLADPYIAALSRWLKGDEWMPANAPKVERLTRAVAARPKLAAIWRKHRGG
ncbi:glutathione S-transferase family protein [Roseomonas sp. OT10]|uniref:glutathione S-transferase family protein n=1 Tax=Roseomonas cutis TaxID=2897332 RepID=UPI001E445C8F|nr:glutathione S-transferase family protein [Roseomonas sp. OT10]UFN50794.1 glutathione S-transferase family protein [Roseomonas sp. OT10]